MEATLIKYLKAKKKIVNQLLNEGYIGYNEIPEKDPIAEVLQYRRYFNQSKQGKEITKIIKEVAEKINGKYRFQLFVCDHYEDYLTKLDKVDQVTDFLFEHDWEGSQDDLESPLFIVANKDLVETYSIEETGDLLSIESRISEETVT
ncbi:hypothetical protein ACFP65_03405 [Marinilactibacillus sp. GCM10026970]|uniref:hypothetical protein n=1 Tax=Marinilactibacillus sp. GCM10026970 TaxID=3252642 RepID=UPI00360C9D2A